MYVAVHLITMGQSCRLSTLFRCRLVLALLLCGLVFRTAHSSSAGQAESILACGAVAQVHFEAFEELLTLWAPLTRGVSLPAYTVFCTTVGSSGIWRHSCQGSIAGDYPHSGGPWNKTGMSKLIGSSWSYGVSWCLEV